MEGKKKRLSLRTLNGTLAEWLGNGLQNRVQQFESAGYLKKKAGFAKPAFFVTFNIKVLQN